VPRGGVMQGEEGAGQRTGPTAEDPTFAGLFPNGLKSFVE
jgi:hypothetical protein